MLHINPSGRFMVIPTQTHICLFRMIHHLSKFNRNASKCTSHWQFIIAPYFFILTLNSTLYTQNSTRHTKVPEKLSHRNREGHIHGILKRFPVLKLRSAQKQVTATIYRFAYQFKWAVWRQCRAAWTTKKNRKNLNGSCPIYLYNTLFPVHLDRQNNT